ncbi:MAG: ABC transporter ATP-binding protein [Fluviibacter sp.]|jgi:branched-chain amino acid transport system ATP-binding protein
MLEVRDLKLQYGGIQAVKGISFDVQQGELVALIGANGAGKTSTLKALARMLPQATGQVFLNPPGEAAIDLMRLPAYELVAKGVALVPEGRGVFARQTVLENLKLGAFRVKDRDIIHERLETLLERLPRLKERASQLAGTLSGGEQQMLAIARALMSAPRLLLLDEPSMGLAPIMVDRIFELITSARDSGVSILLVEQNARLALKVSSRAYVLEAGKITLSGNSAELLQDDRVRAAYLGEAIHS